MLFIVLNVVAMLLCAYVAGVYITKERYGYGVYFTILALVNFVCFAINLFRL
jgi:hypothetical protein